MQVQTRIQTSAGFQKRRLCGLTLGLLMLDATSPGLAHVPASAGWQPPMPGAMHAPTSFAHSSWDRWGSFDVGKSLGSLHLVGQPVGQTVAGQNKTGSSVLHRYAPSTLNSAAGFKHNQQVVNVASGVAQSIDLDLTSTSANIVLGTSLFGSAKQLTINVGGIEQTFKPGTTATAAEYVALQQVAGRGNQANCIKTARVPPSVDTSPSTQLTKERFRGLWCRHR